MPKVELHCPGRRVARHGGRLYVAVFAFWVAGCAGPEAERVGGPSPFADCYHQSLANISLPEVSAVRRAGQAWTYAKPFSEVWEASLDVLSQYQAIIALNTSSSECLLLVMKAREDQRS